MKTQKSLALAGLKRILARDLARMETQRSCALPTLADPTLEARAKRLLDCPDPPTGDDRIVCLELVRPSPRPPKP